MIVIADRSHHACDGQVRKQCTLSCSWVLQYYTVRRCAAVRVSVANQCRETNKHPNKQTHEQMNRKHAK